MSPRLVGSRYAQGKFDALAGLHRLGAAVHVLEKQKQILPLFAGKPARWLHPWVYDWPFEESRLDEAGLPLLNWRHGLVEDVAEQLRHGWKDVARDVPVELEVDDVHIDELRNGRRIVTWDPHGRHSVKVVVLAVGFGLEDAGTVGEARYWERDDFEATPVDGKHREWMVSGCGDGALTDLFRLCIKDFKHSELRDWIDRDRRIDAIRARIREIENDPKLLRDRVALHEAYMNLDADWLPLDLREDTEVTLNVVDPIFLTTGASALNRFLTAQLARRKAFTLRPGRVSSVERRGERFVVTLDTKRQYEFDRIVRRHGVEPALKEDFPLIWEALGPQRESRENTPTLMAHSRKRHWREGMFGGGAGAPSGRRNDDGDASSSLAGRLAELRAELKQRTIAGEDTRDVNAAILSVRRQLREGLKLVPECILNDRYTLLEKVGKGGFAAVWKSYDELEGQLVAVKVLHGQWAEDRSRLERFQRGAREMAKLRHPAIVPIIEAAQRDGEHHYFVMPWYERGDLRAAMKAGHVDREGALKAVASALEGLLVAHAAGLVHRDVKPDNILLDKQGRAALSDFDLVLAEHTTAGTQTNVGMGSFFYAAPEQMMNAKDVDHRADIYSAGMCVLFALTGQDPPPLHARRVWTDYVDNVDCGESLREAIRAVIADEADERISGRQLLVAIRADMEMPALATSWSGAVIMKEARLVRDVWPVESGQDQYGEWAAFRVGSVVQRMRWIEPGSFIMGSPPTEEGRYDDEGPQHIVTLTKGFWLADTPCTQALWQEVMGTNPSRFRAPLLPVERISWDDVQMFLETLNERIPGLDVGLPSEAQWEYACRAGTETATHTGRDDAAFLNEIAWWNGNSGGGTRLVGKKAPNAWGLRDMLGNVYEWCGDHYNASAYERGVVSDPFESTGRDGVIRGGGWDSGARNVRAAYRRWYPLDGSSDRLGFRLARCQSSPR
ncbi:MAG: SUMF1/EgtB/PvdO family nonheme iron enzyme [Deltaproteobacteria bacterium]|nr:SUMF1/EgtB/PvdO family nonheme iron enzyme [Deltaproteobacteria bacterium]